MKLSLNLTYHPYPYLQLLFNLNYTLPLIYLKSLKIFIIFFHFSYSSKCSIYCIFYKDNCIYKLISRLYFQNSSYHLFLKNLYNCILYLSENKKVTPEISMISRATLLNSIEFNYYFSLRRLTAASNPPKIPNPNPANPVLVSVAPVFGNCLTFSTVTFLKM